MEHSGANMVSEIRSASRDLVRQFGLLNLEVAGTDLSASAVHAIIEIGQVGSLSSKELCEKLILEKSTVSRLIKRLIERGEVHEVRSKEDARVKHLSLTSQGKRSLENINRFAHSQVAGAISQLDRTTTKGILKGLQDYSIALKHNMKHNTIAPMQKQQVDIKTGYAPTLIARILEMFLLHMHNKYGFGQSFESRVAMDVVKFLERLQNPENQIWRAEQEGRIIGTLAIDGQNIGNGIAHLRWFAVDKNVRGGGIGEQLLAAGMDFCREQKFKQCNLWTVKGLEAARALYERHGFKLAEEYYGDQWGKKVLEHKFVRTF